MPRTPRREPLPPFIARPRRRLERRTILYTLVVNGCDRLGVISSCFPNDQPRHWRFGSVAPAMAIVLIGTSVGVASAIITGVVTACKS